MKPVERVRASLQGRMRSVRSHPLLHLPALHEIVRERVGGYVADPSHQPHLAEAIAWLERAQDATPDDGFARGFSLVRDPFFGWLGWQPSYPETTGYIIPTMLMAADRLNRPELAERARRAAHWEITIQLATGAVRGGVITQKPSPAVFNTGQVLFGWVATARRWNDETCARAAERASVYLIEAMGADGLWAKGKSEFARGGLELYNARTAWALAEAGELLNEPRFTAAAQTALDAVARRQHANGWFPDCCLNDPSRPLLHTLAYTTRGLVEGGRVLHSEQLIEHGARAAQALAQSVDERGWMPGRYRPDWSAAVSWSCLTGQAQTANNWMRLHEITGEKQWLSRVPDVLRFIKSTQNRVSRDNGVRGGIKGSAPVSGAYGRYELLNWATKYFADALMRHEQILRGQSADAGFSYLA